MIYYLYVHRIGMWWKIHAQMWSGVGVGVGVVMGMVCMKWEAWGTGNGQYMGGHKAED